jgi:hypothetical protein
VTFEWDANDEDDLAGYRIHYGTSSRNYSTTEDVGDTTEYTVTGLDEGITYYFAATAYNTSDNESGYSEEFIYTTGLSKQPVPDIKANSSDGPLTITKFDSLIVEVTLDPGIYTGYPVDWWVLANAPFGWYYYDLINWQSGQSVTYQGGLIDLAPYEVLNTSSLPIGAYIFYFGVDGNVNGIIDNPLFYDSVEVNITP